jgi:tetratricopeptide (TPR) repeat protein
MAPITSEPILISTPATAEKTMGFTARPGAILSCICAATFVLYLGTAWFGFVLDDVYQVLDTAAIHSWGYFFGYFTTATFATPYYRPLLLTWFRINDALFGANATGWHLSSVALHVAVTALVYALARRLGGTTTVALVAALIFGVHPIHIQSAAWVSDACDPLSAVFVLAAFLAWVHGEQRSSAAWKAAAAASYVLGLLTKEGAVVLPALIVAYAAMYTDGNWKDKARWAISGALPFAVITAAYLYVHEELTRSVVGNQMNLSFTTALLTVPSLVMFYLKKLFVPIGLSGFYDNPYISTASLKDFFLPLIVLAVAAGAVWLWQRRAKESRLIAFSACWFVLTLAPALDVRKLPHDGAAHDRYLYLASVGFSILIALGLEQMLARSAAVDRERLTAVAAIAMAVVLAGLNLPQQVYWANDFLLYQRGVEIAPGNDRARNNLGRVLAERGDFRGAETMFVDILSRNPDSALAHYNLGYTLYRQGRYAEAEPHLVRAIAGEPSNPFMHLYLGLTAMREGKLDIAESEVGQAVRMRPGLLGFHLALSYVLESKGDLGGALQETRAELAHAPGNAAIRERAAELQARVGTRPATAAAPTRTP